MKIAFIGTGMIGGGLAVNAMLAGNEVRVYDVIPTEKMEETINNILSLMEEAGACTADQVAAAKKTASYTNDLAEAVTGAEFIQESVPERHELKCSTYKSIQEIVGDSAIIASSTSAMFPSKLREGALYPDHIIVGHPYNPSYLLPIMEICAGNEPNLEIVEKAKEVYTAMGKVPVFCRKEINGFIVNRLSWGALDACKESVLGGVCSVEDMDKAIMYGPGLRMAVTGQLMTMSLGVQGGFRQYAQKYGFEPQPEVFDVLAEGIDDYMANRTPEQGQTPEDVVKYRDKMLAGVLKLEGLL